MFIYRTLVGDLLDVRNLPRHSKAAADWLLGRSATRAFRDGDGRGRFHHEPRACKWRLGDKGRGKNTEKAGIGHSGTGLGTPEAAPRNAGLKEEEEVARD